MKYCPKCGTAVPEEASFCPKCGTNFPDAAAPTPLSQNYQQPSVPPCPPTYLALSIIVTALCCLPFGIVGIVKSSSVSREYAIGNYAGPRCQQPSQEMEYHRNLLQCGYLDNPLHHPAGLRIHGRPR